ncbi:nucleotidyltransferase [Coprobacillus sp. AF33-1AC]|uniref:nucleotidyltransferase n=1 Tax=Coprobacillus sp. AF33-1AC TaxID=2292032 RepID=UPI000E49CA38|nr:nucleotidyltransferase [Coprobacillus sp. AF33-1AC]RHM60586.1 nucleotidyltransferase [Coprobacillus sp. AF33-1AC]
MKVLGLIVEYNPFHTGHLYHIQKAKELIQPDYTIAIMSGHFVQRGEVAIVDKFKRSEIAIKYGIDLVVELPFYYVNQSADYFCKGAIDLLYHLGCTDLVFGSESGNTDEFKEIAYAIDHHQEQYDNSVKQYMKQGFRYPDACNQALSKLLNKTVTTPNDLLGLGYVKEVIFNHYPIHLHCLKRTNDYHDQTIKQISSATALRLALKQNKDVKHFLLNEHYSSFYFQEQFFPLLKYKIMISSLQELKNIHLVDEGIEYLLKKVIVKVNHYDELVFSLTSKRYTSLRIQRMLLHILMNNTKTEMNNIPPIDYLHILKMNQKGQHYLNQIKKTCTYQIVTNASKLDHPAFDLELKTASLLTCIYHENKIKQEYRNIPVYQDDI